MLFSSKTGRRFENAQGFTLPEVMVAMGTSMVVVLVASFAFMMAFDVYLRTIRQYETEVEMSALMYNLRSTMATATNIRYGGPAGAALNATTNISQTDEDVARGFIFSITDDAAATSSNYGGEAFTVAQFNREISASNTAGRLGAVQIVYQRPLSSASPRSGAVYIDTEVNPAAGGGWVTVTPVNAPQMYTRLTNFSVDNVKVVDLNGSEVNNTPAVINACLNAAGVAVPCAGRPVVSAEVSMTMRYFSKGSERNFQWCNRSRFSVNASCSSMVNTLYHDVDRKLNVVFVNNALQRQEYLPRRPFGNIYFFSPWVPRGR